MGNRTSCLSGTPSPMCYHPHQKRLKEDLSIPRRDGWRPSLFPGKGTFCPGDPPEAHQSMRCLTFVEALVAYTSWCPPDNVLGLPVTPSSPNPAHHPKAGHSWDSLPWRGERRSRKRTFILGSSLLWLGLRGDSRAWKGTKERGHVSI